MDTSPLMGSPSPLSYNMASPKDPRDVQRLLVTEPDVTTLKDLRNGYLTGREADDDDINRGSFSHLRSGDIYPAEGGAKLGTVQESGLEAASPAYQSLEDADPPAVPPVPLNRVGAGSSVASGTGGGGSEGGGEGHAKIDYETGIAPRRCTDIQCCFVFLLFTVLLLTLLTMSRQFGDVNALTHGRDYYGRICGVSAGVENLPWLYWCRNDAPAQGLPAGLQMTFPSCVAACPISFNAKFQVPCLLQADVVPATIPGGQFNNEETQQVRMQESIIYTAPYPTTPRGGRFCMPQDGALSYSLLNSWDALHPLGRIMRNVTAGTLGHLSWIFFIVALTAILLGYFFTFSIKMCPRTLTLMFVYPAAVLTALVAVWFLLAIIVLINKDFGFSQTYMQKLNPLYQHYDWGFATGCSIGFSIFAALVSTMLVGMAMNFDGASVGDLISAGMQCMREVPGMYWLPAFEAFLKWLIFVFFVDGLRWFFTVGDIQKNRIHVNGARFAGLSRQWNWNHWWIVSIFIWLVGFFWFMEMANCLFQFLLSEGAVAWYFVPKDKAGEKRMKSSPLVQGMKDAVIYHWGSIAYGAFWIPFWRPCRLLYWVTSNLNPEAEPTTCLGKVCACLSCLDMCGLKDCCGAREASKEKVESSESFIKDGFTDIVIRANDFGGEGGASAKAHMLLEHTHRVVQFMYRDQSQTTLCILGVNGIATICSVVTFLICNFAKIYTEESSTLYIANPALVVLLAWVEGAYIAFGFMSAWDHTSDTLLYCYAWNRKFSPKKVDKFIPEAVRAIVGYEDREEDRYPYYGRAKTNMYLRSWLPVGSRSKKKAKEEKEKEGI